MTTIDDTNLLDNLQAAEDGEVKTADSDNPIQHVPEDQLRNLDTLAVALPQVEEGINQAATIAAEAVKLRSRGRICALEAEELATLVPAIQGTPDNPVSYTSVPTSVGVTAAVELLENKAASARDAAVVKAIDCIDKVLARTDNALAVFEAKWIGALACYMQAAEEVKTATGGTPESNSKMYLGNDAAIDVLRQVVVLSRNAEDEHPRLGNLFLAIKEAMAFNNNPERWLLGSGSQLTVGGSSYLLSDLVAGIVHGCRIESTDSRLSYAQYLTTPALLATNLVGDLQKAGQALIERLRETTTKLQAVGDGTEPIGVTAETIGTAAKIAVLLEQIENACKALCDITDAATKFYTECAIGSMVQVASEQTATKTPRYSVRKLF